MPYLRDAPTIRKALDHLLAKDPVFSTLGIDRNDLGWEHVGPGFEGLVRIVIGQQVSTAAARSIWLKVQDGVAVTPKAIIKASEADLRALGLSRAKAVTLKGLSEAMLKGRFNPDKMEDLSDLEVSEALMAMKGFGPWSAQMFLMFGLARPDIWPAGDLGIQYGMQHYLGLPARPDSPHVEREGSRFAPRRTAASLLLWHLKIRADNAKKSGKA